LTGLDWTGLVPRLLVELRPSERMYVRIFTYIPALTNREAFCRRRALQIAISRFGDAIGQFALLLLALGELIRERKLD